MSALSSRFGRNSFGKLVFMPNPDAPRAKIESPLRRMPSQRRSRERVEKILNCARTLIAGKGSDAMRMSEVAEMARISIGSLYQYFPDKSAIIQTLARRYNAEGRKCIEAELSSVRDIDGFRDAFGRLIDIYYGIFLAEPVIRDIWSATQADKALAELEIAESRANAELVVAALARVRPTADLERLTASAFLVMYLGEATMRLAVSVGRAEGDLLVERYKRMVLEELCREDALVSPKSE
jgi:AcrR family transcriptional regulator